MMIPFDLIVGGGPLQQVNKPTQEERKAVWLRLLQRKQQKKKHFWQNKQSVNLLKNNQSMWYFSGDDSLRSSSPR